MKPRVEDPISALAPSLSRQFNDLGLGLENSAGVAARSLLPQAHAAWMVVVKSSQYPRGKVINLLVQSNQRLCIGADPTCNVVLTGQGMSRQHAEIHLDPQRGSLVLTDLQSKSGTYFQPPGMGAYEVRGSVSLVDRCQIWLGREQVGLLFRKKAARAATLTPPGKGTGPTIRWLYDVERQRTHLVPKLPVSIGNDLDCDLVLGGVGNPISAGTLRMEGEKLSLHPRGLAKLTYGNEAVVGPLSLYDQAEFTLGSSSLILFETAMES